MWKTFKEYGCQPTSISKPSRRPAGLGGGEGLSWPEPLLLIGTTTEETVKVDEINPVPVEETESAEKNRKK